MSGTIVIGPESCCPDESCVELRPKRAFEISPPKSLEIGGQNLNRPQKSAAWITPFKTTTSNPEGGPGMQGDRETQKTVRGAASKPTLLIQTTEA